MSDQLFRTLDSLQTPQIIVPFLEKAILNVDWPEEYAVHVYNKERTPDGCFHPSSDITNDLLWLYYKMRSYSHPEEKLLQEPMDPSLAMTMQIGSAIHAVIQSMLIHLGLCTIDDVEVKFRYEDLRVSGTTDLLHMRLPSKIDPVVDIKSCSVLPTKADSKHIKQLLIYMLFADPDGPRDVGGLLYIEKAHPHRMRDFTVHPDKEMTDHILTNWARVLEALEFQDPGSFLDTCCLYQDNKKRLRCPARDFCKVSNMEGYNVIV